MLTWKFSEHIKKRAKWAYLFSWKCFFTFRTSEKLFFVLSYFRFYKMNFFPWNFMPWEAFIHKYFEFFWETRKKNSAWQVLGKLSDWKFLRVTRKIMEYLRKMLLTASDSSRKNSSNRIWSNSEQRTTFNCAKWLTTDRFEDIDKLVNVN